MVKISRELKFRAWDKNREEYLSAGNLFISINPHSRPLNSFVYLDLIDSPDKYKERFVIEQYTGLRDKNGSEIFEGDIVIYKNEEESGLCKVVRYNHGFFARWIESETFTDIETSFMYLQCNKELEIIGNIHDNQELLS